MLALVFFLPFLCCRYLDESQKFAFHVLVNQGLTFMCFAKTELEKGQCLDFLYDLAAGFVENYAASLDDVDLEVFRDFETAMVELMEEHGQAKGQAQANRVDNLRNKQFCGLRDSVGAVLPVRATEVDVSVLGVCAKVVVTKKYKNTTEAAQDVFFSFKIDGALVVSFETSRGKDQAAVRAVSEEWRTDAAFVVRELTRGGRATFLLEESSDAEMLNVMLGTLAPGEKIKATLSYVTQMEMSGSLFELFVPATRVWSDASDSVFSLTIQLAMASEIVGVACESGHEIECEKTGHTAVVTVDSENILRVNAELLLYVTVSSPHTPQLSIERGAAKGSPVTICLGWNPLFRSNLAEDTAAEFVFLVDRSRALQGRKLGRVRAALLLWLHSLPTGCTFNIIGFGDTVLKLFAVPQVYSDLTMRQAMGYVKDLEAAAGHGGLATALHQAFQHPVSDGKTRQLFVLLADESGSENGAEVLPIVAAGSLTSRLYSFALGPRSNQSLARRMAKVASGFYEYLPTDQFLESAFVDRVVRSSGPGLTGVQMDWSLGEVEQIPAALPCVFSDNRNFFIVYGSVPAEAFALAPNGNIKITIRGCVLAVDDGKEVAKREVVVSSPEIPISSVRVGDVLALNCRTRLVAELFAVAGNATTGGAGSRAATRARLVREACAAGLQLDGVTEWRMINQKTQRPDTLVKFVPQCAASAAVSAGGDVPVKHACEPIVPKREPELAKSFAQPASPPPAAAPAATAGGAGTGKEEKKSFWGWLGGEDEKKKSAAAAASAASVEAGRTRSVTTRAPLAKELVHDLYDESDREPFFPAADDLEQFLALQRANGRWLHDAPFVGFLTKKMEVSRMAVMTVPKRIKDLPLTGQQHLDLWATCLGVQLLFVRFEDVEPTWAGIASKSKGFLFRLVRRTSPPSATVQQVAGEAKTLLELASKVISAELPEQ